MEGMMGGMMRGMQHSGIWAINGVAATGDVMEPFLTLRRGRSYVLAMHNHTAWHHPMHLHGHAFRVIARDGQPTRYREWPRQRIQEILAEHDTAANVVLSHGNVDHYRWIPHVLGALSVQHIWQGGDPDTYGSDGLPQWIDRQEARGAMIHRDFPARWHNDGQPLGDELSCGLASTFVLTVNSGGSKNTDSLVLMIEYEDFTAIFAGDAVGITEEFAEANFRGAVKASVLSASHHGAATFDSNSAAWAEATSPAMIVYSSGQLHGHPRCPATEVYQSFLVAAPNHETHCNRTTDYAQREITDSELAEYTTDVVGSIVVSSNGRSPMRLVCATGTDCGGEFPH